MIDHYRNNTRKDVHVTASTGIAASLIKGTTLHSFVGLGLANEAEDTLYWKIIRQETVRKRWAEAELLIIDEGPCFPFSSLPL
jgi:ATP-dependent DNA helicase PIF1